MIVRDPNGVAVLTLGDEGFVDGYMVRSYTEGDRSFRRVSVQGTHVDGEHDVAVALNRVRLRLVVHIDGSTTAEVRARRDALLEAVEVNRWQLDVDGTVVWVCGVADSSTARFEDAPQTLARVVTLTIPAQPGTYGY